MVWIAALGVVAGGLVVGGALSTDDPPVTDVVTPPPTPSVATASPSPSPAPARDVLDGVTLDALQQEHLDELRDFTGWLEENDAHGFVGEVGWPAGSDLAWSGLGEYWYLLAEQEGLWTAAWAAGSHWDDGYPLITYGDDGSGSLDTASGQGAVMEQLQTDRTVTGSDEDGAARHGVNIAGLEFGTDGGFSNANPGALGTDYFAEPLASYAWLSQRGIDLVRLPVRWERLQPTVGGRLDQAYASAVTAQLDAAAAAGIDVIVDLHNYGSYVTASGPLLLGSSSLPADRLADVWLAIAERWGRHAAVLGYGLMNEPHDLVGDDAAGADAWEATTRETVSALRAAGDDHLILVAGYDWSSLARWRETHPTAWIDDDNIRYEAHHYWDRHGEGAYALPYADELAAASAG